MMRTTIVYGRSGKRYFVNGAEVSQAEYEAASPKRFAELLGGVQTVQKQGKQGWPLQLDSLAIHPDDIPKQMERDKKFGVPTQYNPEDGRPIITDNGHRTKYLRSRGVFDAAAGYLQPGPLGKNQNFDGCD
jgi:hypothetical protein